MSDIVEQLRDKSRQDDLDLAERLFREAAAEIERLREEGTVELLKALLEIERLRADNANLVLRARVLDIHASRLKADNERLRVLVEDALDDEVALRRMPKWCEEARAALEPKP